LAELTKSAEMAKQAGLKDTNDHIKSLQYIAALPEGAFPTDLINQKWFSISHYAPLNSWPNLTDSVALQYHINAPMVLFD
jgi:hypothetical protein